MSSNSNECAYLDNNATTQIAPEAVEAMLPFLTEYYGNPSSIHKLGSTVGKAIETAREQVQALLGAEYSSEVIFTSCATEASSTAIFSALEAMPERKEIITSKIEHPATLQVCEHLERKGYKVHYIGVDKKGRLDIAEFKAALSEQTALISFMWANNETGTIFPVEMLANLAKTVGAQVHVDAVQVIGKIHIDVQSTKIDMLSISGHKFHGPKGVGALYLRRGTRFRPLFRGGHQERGRRAGTENAASIIGFGCAAELAQKAIDSEMARIALMRNRLEQGILARVPCTFVTGDPQNRVPNTSNIAIEYIEGEALLLMLNHAEIAASSGSACTSGSLEPSHVMQAMDIPFTAAHGTLRFSLSRYNTDEDIDRVLEHLPAIVQRLRTMSPYWDEVNQCGKEESFTPQYG